MIGPTCGYKRTLDHYLTGQVAWIGIFVDGLTAHELMKRFVVKTSLLSNRPKDGPTKIVEVKHNGLVCVTEPRHRQDTADKQMPETRSPIHCMSSFGCFGGVV